MQNQIFKVSGLVVLLALTTAAHAISWPGNAKVAVSLSYDDALASQLDNAVPTLNQYGVKASFYLILSSPVLKQRLPEWRKLAAIGHELGNHTLFHGCSRSAPGRNWVDVNRDSDKKNVAQITDEITTANAFLYAIDGKTERTFTPPCLETIVGDGDYLPAVSPLFVSVKTFEQFPQGFSAFLMPDGQSGADLIKFVKKSAQSAKIIQILFHGVGGDHLAVTQQAHAQLIAYLAQHPKEYWVDTYINVMSAYQRQNYNTIQSKAAFK